MKKNFIKTFLSIALLSVFTNTNAQQATININTNDVLLIRPQSLIGANIEDLNNQLYGGLYSQLIYGEGFEEEIGVDFLGLSEQEKLKIWVRRDDKNQPYLWYFAGKGYPAANEIEKESRNKFRKPVTLGPLTFTSLFLATNELPGDLGEELTIRFSGNEQISRHWSKVQSNTAEGAFTLDRTGQFRGEQAQQITFNQGNGELGISNAGLNSLGIKFEKGKLYEGILRVKSDKKQTIHVSLRDETGAILADKELLLQALPNKYQRVEFSLTSNAETTSGRFTLTLNKPGEITVDYAYLEAGAWGRYHDLPIRREMAEAVQSMKVNAFRYNGSMVNRSPEGYLYKWKEMIGPSDERKPYHGWFNPYASHGFSFFEFMDFCEALNVDCMFGIRIDETADDVSDLVEYCLGDATTTWGKKRILLGHPKPYRLQIIEIGNEEIANENYLQRVKKLASAIWQKNPDIEIALSINVERNRNWDQQNRTAMLEIVRFVHEQGKSDKLILDSHYQSDIQYADTNLHRYIGLDIHDTIAKHIPGFKLRLWPMEENGSRCDWNRGLAHAHNLNTMNRFPLCVERSGTANTFQAWQQNLVWDQGRIHYTPEKIFYQPSYYIDRMFGVEWLPIVVNAESSEPTLDVTAKMNEKGDVLTLYILNIDKNALETEFEITGFQAKTAYVRRIASNDMKAHNTPEKPESIVPVDVKWKFMDDMKMTVPGYSFTTVRLSKVRQQ
jgi:alpha-L-arabinofuranosidase